LSVAIESAPQRRQTFFLWVAVAFAIAVLWGFGPTYFLRPFLHTRDISWIVHVHALIYIGWIVLFVVQATLVARHKVDLHRRLGVLGVVWGIAVVVAGFAVTLTSLQTPGPRHDAWNAIHGPAASLLWLTRINTGDPMAFGLLFVGAIALRRHSQAHKRLMLLACLALMLAAVARALDDVGWPIYLGPFGFESPNSVFRFLNTPFLSAHGLNNLVLLPFFAALVAYDLFKTRRVHPATIAGGLVVFLLRPFAVLLG